MDHQPSGPAPGAPIEILPAYGAPEAAPARPPRGIVAIGVGVVAALVATLFAVVSLSAGDGAASPEEAVERLLGAAADEDLVGVLEALAPGERSVLVPGVEGIAGELQRIGVLGDDLDLTGVAGVDIEIDGLALDTDELGAGVSAVRITGGTITSSADPAELPLSDKVRELLDAGDVTPEPASSTDDMAGDVAIVAVDDGEGWHVSLLYTLAEAIRAETDQPVPAFGAGVAPEGADSPEGAVRDLVQAAVDLDLRRAIALLPADEMGVLHDYAPLFLDEVDDDVAEARESFDLTVDRLDIESEVDGDTARVMVGGFAVSGQIDGDEVSVDFDGECVTMSSVDVDEETCIDDFAEVMGQTLADHQSEMGVTVVERDGEWFVSPLRTGFDQVLKLLATVDDDALDDVESIEDLLWSMFSGAMGLEGMAFGEFGVEGDSGWESFAPGPCDLTAAEADSGWSSSPMPADGEMPESDPGVLQDECLAWMEENGLLLDDPEASEGPANPIVPDLGSVELAPDGEAVEPDLPLSPVDECWLPIDDLPAGASAADWEAAEALVDDCLAGLEG